MTAIAPDEPPALAGVAAIAVPVIVALAAAWRRAATEQGGRP